MRHRIYLLLSITLLLGACTDKREPEKKMPVRIQRAPRELIQKVGDIRLTKDGQTVDIRAYQIEQKNGSLFVTGTTASAPYLGYAEWNIGADPEQPSIIFSYGNGHTDNFHGGWNTAFFASGAIGMLGNLVFLSGSTGATVVNRSDSANQKEITSYPPYNESEQSVQSDARFIYKGMVAHPSQQILYGLREQDYMVVNRVTQTGLTPVSQIPYGQGTVCCVTGATVFGSRMFVSMRGMLRTYEMGSAGEISAPLDIKSIQAVNVEATQDLLYVQHRPSYGVPAGTGRPAGIYVFDQNGDSIAFLPIEPIKFAVSDDNTHIYANMDDTSVRIFRIEWTNR